MRTVVFSDERVALGVNARFVCVWANRTPSVEFPDRDPYTHPYVHRYEGRIDPSLQLGDGLKNVLSVFATPDGDVLNAVPGYLDVESFFDEMRVALAVREFTMDPDYGPKASADRTYRRIHRSAAALSGDPLGRNVHNLLASQGRLVLGSGVTWNALNELSLYITQSRR